MTGESYRFTGVKYLLTGARIQIYWCEILTGGGVQTYRCDIRTDRCRDTDLKV